MRGVFARGGSSANEAGLEDGDAFVRGGRRKRGSRRLARTTAVGLVLSSALLAGSTIGANPASAANAGTVMCVDQSNVVGVWVQVSGGTSGWARWWPNGVAYYASWSYNTQGRPYVLTVGCGGTPARWASSNSTLYYSTGWSNVMCFPGWRYGGASGWVYNKCFAA